MPLFTYFSCWCVVQSSLAQTEADVVFSVYSSLHFQKSNSITTQLRLERHAKVYKLLLASSFCLPSFYQMKPHDLLPYKNQFTPHMFLYLLVKVSQILVVHPPLPRVTQSWASPRLQILN